MSRAHPHLDLAIADYEASIQLDPNNAKVFFNRADAYAAKKEEDKARADREQAKILEGKKDKN